MRPAKWYAVALLGAAFSQAEAQRLYRTNLAGADTVVVQVWISADDLDRAIQLDSATVRTRVELALRREGLTVVDSLRGVDGIVRVSGIVVAGTSTVAHHWEVAFLEGVTPWRRPDHPYFGKGWYRDSIGSTGLARARGHVLDMLDTLLAEFLNDYLAANPRAP